MSDLTNDDRRFELEINALENHMSGEGWEALGIRALA